MANFRWPPVLTQRGKPGFPICSYDEKKFYCQKGPWAIPPNTEGHSFKTLRFFQVIRLCSHRFTFIIYAYYDLENFFYFFSTVTARIRHWGRDARKLGSRECVEDTDFNTGWCAMLKNNYNIMFKGNRFILDETDMKNWRFNWKWWW